MEVTRDGSLVEVYRRLPAIGEAELIQRAIPAGATVLDLGCGTGRITKGLVAVGHPVTGVDDSPAMIAELPPNVTGVVAEIGALHLPSRFDVALLASHLVNDSPPERASTLATARGHLVADGLLVGEAYAPEFDWAAAVGRTTRLAEVELTLERAAIDDTRVDAVVVYAVGDRSWRQPFVAWMLDEVALSRSLDEAGFRFDRWLGRPGWFLARACPPDRRPVTAPLRSRS